MNAIEHTKKFRKIGVISMLAVGVSAAVLVGLKIVWNDWHVPFVAFVVGLIPVILFHMTRKPTCDKCGGRMKIHSGFPHIVYRCRECGGIVNTGVHSDY